MIQWLIYGLIFLGSALMVFNIYGFVQYARFVNNRRKWESGRAILYIPIALLSMFLIGYLIVGIFGKPDLVMAGILFGGSIFVFVMLILLNRVTRKVMESERLEAELMAAEESNRSKNAFLASISHEMRTPMNVILGLDGLALRRTDLPEETRLQLVKIGRSGRHLLGLINNTLEMQNIENGERSLKAEPFSLGETMDQIEAMARTLCEEKGLRYRMVLAPEVWDSLMGDSMLLKQALMNLLDNAIKYTPAPGDVSLLVDQISGDGDSCLLRFTVKDTGIGISEEFQPKMFNLFTQEDESFTNRYGGSGMGLAVTKQEVELMKGEITAESKQGEGSTFFITVPFLYAAPEEVKTGRAEEMNGGPETGERTGEPEKEHGMCLSGCRILVVEDVDENAEIVTDLLELEGAVTEHAENGLIALGLIERSAPYTYDAVLMDLRMPVMDGLESAGSIRALKREDTKTLPIIALTANAFDVDIENSTKAGMNAHLVKPIDSDLLYATLKEWIGKTKEKRSKEA